MTMGHHQYIPLSKLTPSPLNHRKHFDKTKMAELEDSIRVQGVVVPILARPLNGGDSFEVVAGERRFRAAKAAGLTDIPAIVRELDDAKALELQVIENNQRVDVHPLEEAEGYEALMRFDGATAGKKYTADEIAAKVGKSRSYVFGRLKLCALCPEARKSFYDGGLDASKALLVARIAHHDTQREALKDLTDTTRWGGEAMSYRQAHKHVVEHYMLALKEAPFDIKDEKLVPKAGACGPCPKRTGNQAELFGDVKGADVCTDPKCFDDKRQAHYSVAAKELEAKGKKVLFGAAAKKAFPEWDNPSTWSRDRLGGGYVAMDDSTYASGRNRKVSELLGPDYEPIHVQHPGTGKIVKVATQQAITAAAQKTEKASTSKKSGASSRSRGPEERKPDPAELLRKHLFRHVFAKLPTKLGVDELRWFAEDLLLSDADQQLIADTFLPAAKSAAKGGQSYGAAQRRLEAALPKLDAEGLSRLMVALYITQEDYTGKDKRLEAAAQLYGVDLAAVKKAFAAEQKSPDEKKPEKRAPAKKAKKGA